MIFKLTKASDRNFEGETEINSLKELLEFIRANGTIVMSDKTIEIYDNWRE